MDCKQRVGMWGVVLACTSVGLAKAPPVLRITGDDAMAEFTSGRVYVLENETEGSSEMRAGGDTCATATVIPWPLPVGGYTDTGTTFSAGDQYHTNDCNGDDGRARDLVYKITPTVDTALVISGCPGGSAATPYDARGWVYEGGCPGEGGPDEPIVCSDDGCGDFAGPPHVVFPVSAGVTYYYIQDGWQGGRGNYQIDVDEIVGGPVCDRSMVCSNGVPYGEAIQLGDRFYIPNPEDPPLPDTCAEIEPCPDVPIGSFQCDAGLLFCTGMFCDGLNACPTGTAGSPSRISSDSAGGRGALDNKGYEGFWGIDDAIAGVVVWGEDYTIDPETGLPDANCTKTEFTVTYYSDLNGAPGSIVASFDVTASQTTSGVGFAGSPSGINKFTMSHGPVCLKRGWISVQGKTNIDDPTCEFVWVTTDLTQLATGRDDKHYWHDTDGVRFEEREQGALMYGLAPSVVAVTGACCDDATASCDDNVDCANCPDTARFAAGTACAAIDPLCGRGACCFADGSCNDSFTENQCINVQGGSSFTAGVNCADNPANPAGVHCPPANDDCPVSVAVGGLPYQFTGRTDGATEDAGCTSLGPVVWEAFTLTECTELLLDYCGTSPTFLGAPLGTLLTDCCDTTGALSACSISNTARIGLCCIDDPPGYEGNYSITFPHVPTGTWYYPVRSGAGATGSYTLNVSGDTCSEPGSCVSCTGTAEGEPACSGNNDDCASADPISCGNTVCGTSAVGDEDWFTINVGSSSTLTWSVEAEFPVEIEIIDLALGCGVGDFSNFSLATASACSCSTAVASACVTAGDYALIVRPQAGAAVICGATYSATVTCTPPCTAVVGACCLGASCSNGSTQARCDGQHGHYQGDGTTCASNPCPSRPADDECAGATVIPASIPAGGLTYSINRRDYTAAANDPINNCEAVNAPKDASRWFVWTTGPGIGVARIHLSLCCDDGGPGGDSVISMYNQNVSCANIIANPLGSLQICNDESADCGDERAELCPTATQLGNRTYRIQVQFKDAGGPDEEEDFLLYVRNACTPALVCPAPPICDSPPMCPSNGIVENEPVCSTDFQDNTNNGCSPGNPFNFQPIACGQSYCGETGNYTSNGVGGPDAERDRDWFEFQVTEETVVTWTAQSAGDSVNGPGITAQLWKINPNCSDFTNRAAAVNNDDCTAVVASATIEPGRYAVTVFGRTVDLDPDPGDQLCGTPWVGTLACAESNTLLNTNGAHTRPDNACANAPAINASGRYSGSLNTNGVAFTADGESQCDGAGGDSGFCDDVGELPDNYLKYRATCTGRVTEDACQSPTPVLLSVHTDCPASCSNEITDEGASGQGISCIDFGCGPGGSRPTLTFDVVETRTTSSGWRRSTARTWKARS